MVSTGRATSAAAADWSAWKSRRVKKSGRSAASVAETIFAVDDKLVVFTDEGTLITAEANGEKYTEIAKATILDGRCWTVPVLVQGKILARNAAGKAVCVDVSK